MNRKLFSGLLLLTVATGGVGTFTSCTDDQGFRNEIFSGQEDLSRQIEAIRNLTDPIFLNNLDVEINRLIDARDFASAADVIALKSALEATNKRIDALDSAYKAADEALRKELTKKIETEVNVLREEVEAFKNSITKRLDGVDGELKTINDKLVEFEDRLGKVEQTANDALEQALHNAGEIERLNINLTVLESKMATLEGEVATLRKDVDALQIQYAELFAALSEFETNMNFAIDQLREQVNELNASMDLLYNKMMQKWARFVSGIVVEQVRNSIFGTLNIPIGIESNILANYYALSDHDVIFPPVSSTYEYESTNPVLTGLDLSKIDAPSHMVLSANVPVLESLGGVHLTINPNDRNFQGLEVSLVNSRDEQVLDELQLVKSNSLIHFGGTRAAENNGLYYATANPRMNVQEDIDITKVEVEDGLLTSFKNVIKNHTKSDFLELAKILYKQFSQDIPAYTVKVEWDDTDIAADGTEVAVKRSVRSGYDLAVSTLHPLSYRSGWGFGTDHQLPTPEFGTIQDLVNKFFDKLHNKLDLGLTGVEFEGVSINLDNVKVEVGDQTIVVSLAGLPVYKKGAPQTDENIIGYLGDDAEVILEYKNGAINPDDYALNGLVDAILGAVNDMLHGTGPDSLTTQINEQINEQLRDMIADINSQITGVQGKVDQTIEEIRDKINDELNGSMGHIANSLLDLYNKLATQVNKVLKNPNAYLQVMMAYMGNDGQLHHLSTKADDPTIVAAGSGALELFATSYNAELIVPSFKKYVAVVEAVDDYGYSSLRAAKKANTGYLNTIIPGNQQRVYIDASKLEAGYTYKVIYSSLDYRGYTSTKAYYVRAK